MTVQPLHIAIIPDGNRRWAKKNALKPWKGHEHAAQNFHHLVEWCCEDSRVAALTMWCFSTENWKRDAKEVEKLMVMLQDYLTKERPLFMENQIKLVHSGRKDRFSPELTETMDTLIADTAHHEAFTLNLAVDYGGQDEIIRALKRMTSEGSDQNEAMKQPARPAGGLSDETMREYLDQPDLPDIDLVIRTSGESRTSNFNLWQTVYSEWMFLDKLFPDFSETDLAECIDDYSKRNRRFGA